MREKIDLTPDFDTRINTSIIKVIGVGGGGGNAVAHMYHEGIVGIDYLICNTDKQALFNNPVPSKLIIGETGLGAGANPEVARKLAEESEDKIRDFIGEETKMLFIAAGMGKGTGTGASPVVARIANAMGILTIGVVTFPFCYENCAEQAKKGIEEMEKYVDSLIVIKNEKLISCFPHLTVRDGFARANDVLKNAVKCIAELITVKAEVNIDFNDIKTIMTASKSAMLGIASATGEDRVEEIVDQVFKSPLLDTELIKNAKNLLFFASCGTKAPLTLDELGQLTNKFQSYQSDDVRVIWGFSEDATLDTELRLSLIITDYEDDEAKREKERIEKERIEKERIERERIERERIEKERIERERIERERIERERIERKRIERKNRIDGEEEDSDDEDKGPSDDNKGPKDDKIISQTDFDEVGGAIQMPTNVPEIDPQNPFAKLNLQKEMPQVQNRQMQNTRQQTLFGHQTEMLILNDELYETDENFEKLTNIPRFQSQEDVVIMHVRPKTQIFNDSFSNIPNDFNDLFGSFPD